ncbi:hypothetical protein, partial [Streptomyces sp. P17]|uniref:hypothetical protein n=1 Tax=Streptomyces sp. P17 TaxID=3074716 RepID=UPI0028F43E6D
IRRLGPALHVLDQGTVGAAKGTHTQLSLRKAQLISAGLNQGKQVIKRSHSAKLHHLAAAPQ